MSEFEQIYSQLNEQQRRAVDTIDGPLLVIAGPGTGKTQLLSARVANILQKTDTLAQSILCLTFTDAAALNMRQRLTSMIGELAYDVHISTYHSFASDIIRTYPSFFESIDLETGQDSRMERPIDAITQLQIMAEIILTLPYGDPLYNAKHYVKSVVGVIADFKQADLKPEQITEMAGANKEASQQLSPKIDDILRGMTRMPTKSEQASALFKAVHKVLHDCLHDIAQLAATDLANALDAAAEQHSTKPLTIWKNNWLQKGESGEWLFTNPEQADKLTSLANIFEKYQTALTQSGQYDFNDMIIRTISALKDKPELRFNLQEKYQYILLDEFQDTNAAQFELVKHLVDHPVHEGRPNVMAVGDDDQGIFAFQGADIGNMIAFLKSFKDVVVINLVQNYRSHRDILHVAEGVAGQIESRLHHTLQGVNKIIQAAARDLPPDATIVRSEFGSNASEYGWIAEQIAELIQSGTPAHEIAVLAPKHSILEDLVPFLNKQGVPVTYEKRENIFETPIISGLLLFSEVLMAASERNMAVLDQLLPQLLSLDYWQLKTEDIWRLNWEYHSRQFKDPIPWAELALQNPKTAEPVRFVLQLALQANNTPLEQMLDFINGATALPMGSSSDYTSPLKEYYFGKSARERSPQAFYEAISHLSVIRQHLRDQQAQTDTQLSLNSLLSLYHTYQEAEQPLINTHPIAQAESAVQLQTVYKAKGLEYEYVFLPFMHDDVWGSSVSGQSSKIALPANLQHVKHDGSTEDNRRRLLFVAITRAKHGLFTTSHAAKENGRQTLPAKYYQESEIDGVRQSGILPAKHNQVIQIRREPAAAQQDVDTLWHSRHQLLTPSLKSLLTDRLQHYVMSPTHLNTFTNLEYAGPQAFLLGTLLRFPQAQTADSLYGDALHATLEWYQNQGINGGWPTIAATVTGFEKQLHKTYLSQTDKSQLITRGGNALRSYLGANAKRLQTYAKPEVDFRKEGVIYKGAMLTGKIDRLEIDESSKTVRIIDFKSGKPATKWSADSKYRNYKQQLYFYMLLLEHSQTYKQYSVESASLEFIEPLANGKPAPPLVLRFNADEYTAFKLLLVAVWQRIQKLDLPEATQYPANHKGTADFIAYLTETT